jgi:pimeloyl-ACP methyl ester carboxylesterase
MTYQFAAINGTKIHYEERGTGTAVIFIHAGINDLAMWDDQMEPFAQQHRTVRYDVRGWGDTSDPPGQYSDHDDLRGLLKHLGIEQAALVGCSGGGKIALDFALVYPEMVSKLVLVGPGLGGYKFTYEGFADRMETLRDAYGQGDKERAAELWTQVWVDGPARKPEHVETAVRARAHDMILRMFKLPDGAGERQEIDPPAIERLGAIQAPTLIILGEYDAPDIYAIVKLLETQIPDARLVRMADTAHMLNMEKPAEYNQLVLGFLCETSEVSQILEV